MPPSGQDEQGPYWDIQLWEDASNVGLLIHRGEEKAAGAHLPGPATGEVRRPGRAATGPLAWRRRGRGWLGAAVRPGRPAGRSE
jgi:hypothetical protein